MFVRGDPWTKEATMRRIAVLGVVVAVLMGVVVVGSAQDDAWIPGIASFFIPGLGQVLNDEVSKGVLHFVVMLGIDAGARLLLYGLLPFSPGIAIYGGYGIWALSIGWRVFSGLDAYNVAKDAGFTLGWGKDDLTLAYGLRF
jgi:hypothetical protein